MSASLLMLFGKRKSSAPVVTQTIYDTFTDVNNTLLNAHTIAPVNIPVASWSFPTTGTIDIQGNKANVKFVSGGKGIAILNAGAGREDCTITQTVRFPTDDKRSAAIIFRYTDTSNLWYLELVGTIAGVTVDKLRIVEITSGTTTVRASSTITPAKLVDHALSLTLLGNQISATVNGGNAITYTSAVRNTATTHGTGAFTTNDASGVTIDDFIISP